MKVAFQMDENINFKTDTTFVLIKEAQRRKHEVFVYAPNNLYQFPLHDKQMDNNGRKAIMK